MIIYEVSLSVDKDIYPRYHEWLKKHVKDMLDVPGFMQASILKPENEYVTDKEQLTVLYRLDTRESLDVYFKEYAAKVREEGLRLFKDKFSVQRRIYQVQAHVSK